MLKRLKNMSARLFGLKERIIAYKGISIIIFVFIIALIIASGYILKTSLYNIKSTTTSRIEYSSAQNGNIIQVESNYPGIEMNLSSECDNDTQLYQTPFSCSVNANESEIVVTAPPQTVLGGKNYIFKSWSGCSTSNDDWKICKVVFEKNTPVLLSAAYMSSTEFDYSASTSSDSSTTSPGNSPDNQVPKNLRQQCEDSKVISTEDNYIRCTVASDQLMIGLDWKNNPEPVVQPPITVSCLEVNTQDCKVTFYYAQPGNAPLLIRKGASGVINNSYSIKGPNPGPNIPSHTISGASNDVNISHRVIVTVSSPIDFVSDNDKYKFDSYFIYVPSYQRAGTSSDYFNLIFNKTSK